MTGCSRLRRSVAAALAVTTIVSAGCGDEPKREGGARPRNAGELVSAQPIRPEADLPAGTRAQRITYRSTTPAGKPITVSGVTLEPPGDAPPGGWPVISWAHGTTGLDDRCAPSADPRLAGYGTLLARFLRAGYAITATDYAGLGTPGTHPYLIDESAARSVVDAVPAARSAVGSFGKRWFAVGHSQGGQAAVATAEAADEYDPGLDFRGAVGLAPAPNLSDTLADSGAVGPTDAAFYTLMLIGMRTQHPELRYADYLGPRARALLPAARSLCIDDLLNRFAKARVPSAQYEPRNGAATERLRKWFAENEIGRRRADAPVLVAQGLADPVVPPGLTKEMVADARRRGSDVRYETYRGADHGKVLEVAAPEVLAWLAARRGG